MNRQTKHKPRQGVPQTTSVCSIQGNFIWQEVWPLRELFFSDTSLWNQYKLIAFNIFSRKMFSKVLTITVTSNERTNKLTIFAKSYQNVRIFYWQMILCFIYRKNWECVGIQNEVIWVAVSLKKNLNYIKITFFKIY